MKIFILFSYFSIAVLGAETNFSVIKKAEELILKRDRSAALEQLISAAERLKNRPKEQGVLIERARTVSRMFFTDEGQKAYESASNLYFYSPKEARSKAEKALQLEPGNIRILELFFQIDLKEGQCSAAKRRFEEMSTVVFTDAEKAYQNALVSYCEKQGFLEVELKRADPPLKDFFLGVHAAREKKFVAAKTHLVQAAEKDPEFPENYYWLWKTDETLEENGIKYLQICKNAEARIFRKYKSFPFLCAHVNELPSFEVKDDI